MSSNNRNNRGVRRNNRPMPNAKACEDFLKSELMPMKLVNGKKVPPINITFSKEYFEKSMSEALFDNTLFFSSLVPPNAVKTEEDFKKACFLLYLYFTFSQHGGDSNDLTPVQKEIDKNIMGFLEDVLGVTEPTDEEREAYKREMAKIESENPTLFPNVKNTNVSSKNIQEAIAKGISANSTNVSAASSSTAAAGSGSVAAATNVPPMSPNEILDIAKKLSVLIARCKFTDATRLEINEQTYNEIAHSFGTHNMPFPYAWEQFAMIWPNKNTLFVLQGTSVSTKEANSAAEEVELLTHVKTKDFANVIYAVFITVVFLNTLQQEENFAECIGRATMIVHLVLENVDALLDGDKKVLEKIAASSQVIAEYQGDPDRLIQSYIGNDASALAQIAEEDDELSALESANVLGGGLQQGGGLGKIFRAALFALVASAQVREVEGVWYNPLSWFSSNATPAVSLQPSSTPGPTPSIKPSATATATPSATQDPLASTRAALVQDLLDLRNRSNYGDGQNLFSEAPFTSVGSLNQSAPPSSWSPAPSPTPGAPKNVVPTPQPKKPVNGALATMAQMSGLPLNALESARREQPGGLVPREQARYPIPDALLSSLSPVEQNMVMAQRRLQQNQSLAAYRATVGGPLVASVPRVTVTSLAAIAHDSVKGMLSPDAHKFYGYLQSGMIPVCGEACNQGMLGLFGNAPLDYRPFLNRGERTVQQDVRRQTDQEYNQLVRSFPQYGSVAATISSQTVFEAFLPIANRTVSYELGGKTASINPETEISLEFTNPLVKEVLNNIGNGGQEYELGNVKLVFDANAGVKLKNTATKEESTVGQALRKGKNIVSSMIDVFSDPSAKDVVLPDLQGWAVQFYKKGDTILDSKYAFTTYIPANQYALLSPLSIGFMGTQYPEYLNAAANFVKDPVAVKTVDIRTIGFISPTLAISSMTGVPKSLTQFINAERTYRLVKLRNTIADFMDHGLTTVSGWTGHSDEQVRTMAVTFLTQGQAVQSALVLGSQGAFTTNASMENTKSVLAAFKAVGANMTDEQLNLASTKAAEGFLTAAKNLLDPAVKVAKAANNVYQEAGESVLTMSEIVSKFLRIGIELIPTMVILQVFGHMVKADNAAESGGLVATAVESIKSGRDIANLVLKLPGVVGAVGQGITFSLIGAVAVPMQYMQGSKGYFMGFYLAYYFGPRTVGYVSATGKKWLDGLRALCGRETPVQKAEREAKEQAALANAAEKLASAVEKKAAANARIKAAAAAAAKAKADAEGAAAAASGNGSSSAAAGLGSEGGRHRRRRATRKHKKSKSHKKSQHRTRRR